MVGSLSEVLGIFQVQSIIVLQWTAQVCPSPERVARLGRQTWLQDGKFAIYGKSITGGRAVRHAICAVLVEYEADERRQSVVVRM